MFSCHITVGALAAALKLRGIGYVNSDHVITKSLELSDDWCAGSNRRSRPEIKAPEQCAQSADVVHINPSKPESVCVYRGEDQLSGVLAAY